MKKEDMRVGGRYYCQFGFTFECKTATCVGLADDRAILIFDFQFDKRTEAIAILYDRVVCPVQVVSKPEKKGWFSWLLP